MAGYGAKQGVGAVTASLEANHMSMRWTAGRQEAAAGLRASLEASWATRGVAGCGRVWGQAGGDGAVMAQ